MNTLLRAFNYLTKKIVKLTVRIFHHSYKWATSYKLIPAQSTEQNQRLLTAAAQGNIFSVEACLKAGADINCVDNEDRNTPLLLAARNGHLTTVALLLYAGANINQANLSGLTALMLSAIEGHYNIFHYLLTHNPDILLRSITTYTVLQWVIVYERLNMLVLLIEHGVKLNERHDEGNTPLLTAVIANKLTVVKLLLSHGAKIDELNDQGESALILAKKYNREELYEYLLQYMNAGKIITSRHNDAQSITQLRLKLANVYYENIPTQNSQLLKPEVKHQTIHKFNHDTKAYIRTRKIKKRNIKSNSSTMETLRETFLEDSEDSSLLKMELPATEVIHEMSDSLSPDNSFENSSSSILEILQDKASPMLFKPTLSVLKINPSELPDIVKTIMQKLTAQSFMAYLVGGCIRNFILQQKSSDFDMITNASLSTVMQIIGVGISSKHVNNLYKIFIDDISIDILCEQSCDLLTDAKKRDFTCNALYLDSHCHLYDPLEASLDDIKKNKIVVIGESQRRLEEDPIRLLRLVRFIGQYEFHIDEKLEKTAKEMANLITKFPHSQLQFELRKIFLRGFAVKNYRVLKRFELLAYIFPSVDTKLFDEQRINSWIESKLHQTDQIVELKQPVSLHYVFAIFQVATQATFEQNTPYQSEYGTSSSPLTSTYSFFSKVDQLSSQLIKELSYQNSAISNMHVSHNKV